MSTPTDQPLSQAPSSAAPAEPEDDRDYYDMEPECCWACHGDGWYHDCGEDTCCCLHPEIDYIYPCEECGGSGEL